jgi:hypothetical protein
VPLAGERGGKPTELSRHRSMDEKHSHLIRRREEFAPRRIANFRRTSLIRNKSCYKLFKKTDQKSVKSILIPLSVVFTIFVF